jgi:TolB-like protein/Flp pilus assembly protein TadD
MRGFRFGVFEIDLRARELRKRGLRVKLQEKPLQILELLLEKAGEIVTREELRHKLWPDTFVGFDRGLNTAMNSLRRALGDSSANPRFVETLARRGYRFVAPVEPFSPPGQVVARATEIIDSVAVLPFQNVSGNPSIEYLGDGITETLIDALSQLPEIRVMARSTVFRYKGKEVDPQTVGRELNVGAVVTGTVMQGSGTLSVNAELVDARRGWRRWGRRFLRQVSDIVSIERELSGEICKQLRLRLTADDKERLEKPYLGTAVAYHEYLRGRYHLNRMTEDGLERSIGHFDRAARMDSSFALPRAGLADSHVLLAFFGIRAAQVVMPVAEREARKALEIDGTLPEAHLSLAEIQKAYHWNWSAAEAEYQSALQLNPNFANAHRLYADFLSGLARVEEAEREMERAMELDPLSLIIHMETAWNSYMARHYEQSVDRALRTLEIEPQFMPAYNILGLAYEQMGKYKEAFRALQKARAGENPIGLASLVHAYGQSGRKTDARKILKGLYSVARRRYVPPYSMALAYLGLDDKQQVLKWLNKACEKHDAWLVWILRDPRMDAIRNERRFQEVLHRMNLHS